MKLHLYRLRSRKLVAILLGVLCSTLLFAQVPWTGSEIVIPTTEDMLLVDDLTAYYLTDAIHEATGGPSSAVADVAGTYEIKNDLIEYINGGDYLEYQVISVEDGQFAITVPVSSKRAESSVNVSVYEVDSAFVMNGTTTATYNNQWQSPVDYIFPFTVKAGVVYNLRISFVDAGCNIFTEGLQIKEMEGSPDATLKDLTINGVTVDGFAPDVYEYSVALPLYEWVNALSAVANDSTTTVDIPESVEKVGQKGTAEITCTSTAGIILTYTVNVVSPTEVYDDFSLGLYDADMYYSNSVNMAGTKLNSIENESYVDYYIYSFNEVNYSVTLECTNGYVAESYLNVSTLALDDSTWTVDSRNSKQIPLTYQVADPTVLEWDKTLCVPNYISFVVSLKEDEPVLLRIYGITTSRNAADISNITFEEIDGSINTSLSDLTVDGSTVMDFDTLSNTFNVPLAIGATTATTEATPSDAAATVTGDGVVNLAGYKTTDTINVVSESGFDLDYFVNLYTPVEIDFSLMDTVPVQMASTLFYNGGANVTDALINKSYDSAYVDYYIYSVNDQDVHLVANVANGNPDTIMCEMNASTYTYGSEWELDDANTRNIVNTAGWSSELAEEYTFNLSLKAGEPVMARMFFITDGTLGAGDIHSLSFVEGHVASLQSTQASAIKIWGGSSCLNVNLESYAGTTVRVYDITGRVVIDKLAQSSNEVYSISKAGMYIVQVIDVNNDVKTVKCLVR